MSNLQGNFGLEILLGFSDLEKETFQNINPIDVEYLEAKNKQLVPPFESLENMSSVCLNTKSTIFDNEKMAAKATLGYLALTLICFLLVVIIPN